MILKHPTLSDVTRTVPDSEVGRWRSAGWVPLLDEAQVARFEELEDEADALAAAACPTCGAVGDEPCVTFHTNEPTRRHANRPPLPQDFDES